jgi:hypothetical protein
MKAFRSAACLALAGCLAAPAAAQFKSGVEVRIKTRDGHSIRGELLVVRSAAFVIAVADSDREMTIDHASIRTLETERKTSTVRTGLFGLLVGAALGGASGFHAYLDPEKNPNISPVTRRAAIGGGIGFLAGAGVALWKGRAETYDFTSIRPSQRVALLERLRQRSRYPGVK